MGVIRRTIDKFAWAIIFGRNGSGGTLPQLHSATISIEGSVITITNPSENGDFVTGYDLYCNGQVVATTSSTTIDLEDISGMPTGTDTFSVKCKGNHFRDSSASNTVTYAVENALYTSESDAFYTSEDEEFIVA